MEYSRQSNLFDFLGNKVESENKNNRGFNFHPSPAEKMNELESKCQDCFACQLRRNCRQPVFGEGNPETVLMLVGEAPGADEDKQGFPFVGSAGQLLNKILEAVEVAREDVYITNVVKCRPPGNRLPSTSEIQECYYFLERQIKLISPRIIVCLGSLSTKTLIKKDALITQIRGEWRKIEGRWYMPTFHPAALLRDARKKKPVWEDFKKVKAMCEEINRAQD